MANIEKTNSRQKAVNTDLTLDRNLAILIDRMGSWISENSQAGITANRPTENLYDGRTYDDTTINIKVTYINGAWRNGAGVAV
jgi:hypothetical protein